ncbi:MAG: glycosyltransferase family 4 protein, partial [Patescibacteria group bacterium]
MRILIATGIFPPDIGGPATYSKILADELPKRGVGVEILSFGSVRGLPKIIRHLVYFFKVFWRARHADVIFAQDPVSVGLPAYFVALILKKLFVLKVVGDYAWEQGVNRFGVKDLLGDFLHKKYDWRIEFLRFIERFVAKSAKVIIVPSDYLKSVVKKWGVRAEKIHVIYNAVSIPEISKNKEELRQELNLSGKVLVSVGRLVSWKGFEMLIELMPEVSKKYPDAQLLIIGSGPEEKTLNAKSYQLKTNVRFLGSLTHDQVLKYLKTADVFLLNTGYVSLARKCKKFL